MALEKLGPYRLIKVLGRGGMGAVYIGETEKGERAAIKVLSPALSDEPGFRDRFQGEVETLKRLLHPNIVQLYGFGEDDGHLFYSMELVEGRSLQEELSSGRRFHWREVAKIGIEVAKALKHAHDRGIVHRDLKPANLMIDPQDHIKLTDFGIAKLYGGTSLTSDGGVLGTADYMSPEQAEGKQVSPRCDLYSLGSVLYALLAGRPPFAAKSLPEVIHRLRFEEPIPIHRLAPDTPDEFAQIIDQLLAKDPQKRIATAVAVANRLRAMEHALSMETQVGQSPLASPESPPPSKPTSNATSISQGNSNVTAVHTRADITNPTAALGDMTKQGLPSLAQSMPTAAPTYRGDALKAAEVPPPIQKSTHFTTVSEADLRQRDRSHDDEESGLASILRTTALLIVTVAVLVGGGWYMLKPPTADQLFAKVEPAISSGDPQQMASVESDIQRCLKTFPDDSRAAPLKTALEAIELYRLEKRFELRARVASTTQGADPAENWYLQAVAMAKSDPAAAKLRFQALVDTFSTSTDDSEDATRRRSIADLCKKQIEKIESAESSLKQKEEALLEQQLAEVAKLSSSDASKAKQILSGLSVLYASKPWATEKIAAAQASLAGASGPSTP